MEQRFHFLKDPAFVDAVFLQKPERIQRRVRQAPEPFPTAYRGRVARPTGHLILPPCRGIHVLWRDATHRYLAVPAAHRPAVRGILQALALTETIYTMVPARAAPS